jgi:hypothetical protein
LSKEATALETVGALSPLSLATSARDSGPRVWSNRSTIRSFNFPTTAGRIVVIEEIVRESVLSIFEKDKGSKVVCKEDLVKEI